MLHLNSLDSESVDDYRERLELYFEHIKKQKMIKIESNLYNQLQKEYHEKEKEELIKIEKIYHKNFMQDIESILSQNPTKHASNVFKTIFDSLQLQTNHKINLYQQRFTNLQESLMQIEDRHNQNLTVLFLKQKDFLKTIHEYQTEFNHKAQMQTKIMQNELTKLMEEKEKEFNKIVQLSHDLPEIIEKKKQELQSEKDSLNNIQLTIHRTHLQYQKKLNGIMQMISSLSQHIETETSAISKKKNYVWQSEFKESLISKTTTTEEYINHLLSNIESQYPELQSN